MLNYMHVFCSQMILNNLKFLQYLSELETGRLQIFKTDISTITTQNAPIFDDYSSSDEPSPETEPFLLPVRRYGKVSPSVHQIE